MPDLLVKAQKENEIWVRSSAGGLAVVSPIQRLMERETQNVMSGQE